MKLVVTRRDQDGKSVFADDEKPLQSIPFPDGGGFDELWLAREGDLLADAEELMEQAAFYPDPGETRFRVVKLMPDYLDRLEHASSNEAEQTEGSKVLESDTPGMHSTATIDFVIVLGGQVALEHDDGATRLLGPGDCVVQRATRHRWVPQSAEPVVMAVVMLGAKADPS